MEYIEVYLYGVLAAYINIIILLILSNSNEAKYAINSPTTLLLVVPILSLTSWTILIAIIVNKLHYLLHKE